jgi:alpha-tubulin suppressor-like RCC1 family protein
VSKISCGDWHTAALLQDGKVVCWGANARDNVASLLVKKMQLLFAVVGFTQ